METTLHSLFRTALDRFGGRPAVRVGDAEVTYAELVAAANRLARKLIALGVAPGDPVALMMSNRIEWIVADQAIIRAGAAKVPVNTMLSEPEVAFILDDCGARVALADEPLASIARAFGVESVLVPGDEGWQGEPAAGPPDVVVSGSDRALILYTGGTTGRQKGVVHDQAGLSLNLLAHVIEIGLQDDERILLSSPLPHSAGFLAQAGLLKGARVGIEPRFDADRMLELIERDAVTFLFLVPTMIYRLLDAADGTDVDVTSLRTILYGAAPITPERLTAGLDRFGPVFMQLYGQSEAPNFLTRLTREDHDPDRPDRLQSCGRAASMVDLAILDDDGAVLAPGGIGEVCARAPYVMTGYHGLPDKTAATVRDGWLHTGDIGVLDDDGYLRLLDRRHDMVISGGMNVYTGEVENVLSTCAGVDRVAVVGVPHPDWGEAVVAFVVAGDTFDAAATDGRCRAELAAYKRPKAYELVETLPTTPFGKIDKKALRAAWTRW
ncbi:class I adenylate-forming enzyme family protein [Pseudonocardia endophytica]|uniref:Fatty-acyl-CoA synthase/long-chain acyl-CoA synthetase n=1 Tax=Pseudonocardia endophytica TaxID=401976 RepID=A0A4R1HLJ5_PSEEN|nr:AMP-binding protein [Pseudonocardia endophytica]TCK21971.1 fatty-acyl-CoA synthase/long-chain acyl-CoA synthetase [Pseudonocardia endophytica]